VHEPLQAPDTQAWLAQATPAPQLPFVSQVCTLLPLHWVVPGEHDPLHAPLTQTWLVHAAAVPQAPMALQV